MKRQILAASVAAFLILSSPVFAIDPKIDTFGFVDKRQPQTPAQNTQACLLERQAAVQGVFDKIHQQMGQDRNLDGRILYSIVNGILNLQPKIIIPSPSITGRLANNPLQSLNWASTNLSMLGLYVQGVQQRIAMAPQTNHCTPNFNPALNPTFAPSYSPNPNQIQNLIPYFQNPALYNSAAMNPNMMVQAQMSDPLNQAKAIDDFLNFKALIQLSAEKAFTQEGMHKVKCRSAAFTADRQMQSVPDYRTDISFECEATPKDSETAVKRRINFVLYDCALPRWGRPLGPSLSIANSSEADAGIEIRKDPQGLKKIPQKIVYNYEIAQILNVPNIPPGSFVEVPPPQVKIVDGENSMNYINPFNPNPQNPGAEAAAKNQLMSVLTQYRAACSIPDVIQPQGPVSMGQIPNQQPVVLPQAPAATAVLPERLVPDAPSYSGTVGSSKRTNAYATEGVNPPPKF